jgi:hypothetical protein
MAGARAIRTRPQPRSSGYGPDPLAPEAGLADRAISYSKGCHIGQKRSRGSAHLRQRRNSTPRLCSCLMTALNCPRQEQSFTKPTGVACHERTGIPAFRRTRPW